MEGLLEVFVPLDSFRTIDAFFTTQYLQTTEIPMSKTVRFTWGVFLTGAFSILLHLSSSAPLSAQTDCRGESTEIPWVIPPAIAGIDGDLSAATAGRVFIGGRNGTLQIWELSLGTLGSSTTKTPGNGLPANLTGIWDIATTSQVNVVALVTYAGNGGEWYGFLRSSDAGENWSLVEPASLQIPRFASVEGKKVGITDWTGNYFRVPLNNMEWLKDGLHGWAWGRQGIVKTTDGGATWSVAYDEVDATPRLGSPDYSAVWGMAMKSPTEGVAVIGARIGGSLMSTTDGGETWLARQNLTVERLADLDEVGGEYRALVFNGQEREQNARYLVSPDGASWTPKPELKRVMKSETVYPSEALWVNRMTGFVIQREGELWRTDDQGETWSQIQERDSQYDSVKWGDGTSIAGNGTLPFYPYAGYAQRSIIIRDDFGDPYIVHVITDNCAGTIRPYVPVWFINDEFSSVTERFNSSTLDLSVVPNPVSKACQVRFSLDAPSTVVARLVNARGIEVRKTSGATLAAGDQELSFDVDGLPSGMYRVFMTVGDRVESHSVVITH